MNESHSQAFHELILSQSAVQSIEVTLSHSERESNAHSANLSLQQPAVQGESHLMGCLSVTVCQAVSSPVTK